MRNFEDVDGVDGTRRCWDSSEVADKGGDKGPGEFVRKGEGNESAEELTSELMEAGDGGDSGVGRVRDVSASVVTKLDENENN
jgi:hypothetical protein